MKIWALSTKLNQISYSYSVDPQKARNAKTKLSFVQAPRFSFFDPPPPILRGWFLQFYPFGGSLIMYTKFGQVWSNGLEFSFLTLRPILGGYLEMFFFFFKKNVKHYILYNFPFNLEFAVE